MNIFENAARRRLRFPSSVGELNVEQLWELPLTNRKGTNLDAIARSVYLELKGIDEISFVDDKPDPAKVLLELRFEILKHIISTKKEEAAAFRREIEACERKERLLGALASKEEQALAAMSKDEILAELKKLEG